MRLSAERMFVAGFGLALLLLTAVGLVSLRSADRLMQDNGWVTHTHQVLEQLESLLSTLADAETGERGYVVTGDEAFLEPYVAAFDRSDSLLGRLRKLTADQPVQQLRLDSLAPVVVDWMAEVRRLIQLRRMEGFDAARRELATGRGKRLHDSIRSVIDEMEQEELALLRERVARTERAVRSTRAVIIAGNLLAAGLFGLALYFILRDIGLRNTFEAQREQLLAQSQEATSAAERAQSQLKAVFDAVPDGIAVWDMEGNRFLVNQAQVDINGFATLEEMLKDLASFASVYELRSPEGQLIAVEEWPISRVLKGESVADYELLGRRRDTGQESLFSFSGEPVRDEQGRQIMAVVITRDISERKLAEALRQAVTGADVGTWHWNIATGELKWSDRCKILFGIPLETVMSYERFLEALHPHDRERADEAVKSALERHDDYEIELRSVWPDGSVHWVEAKGHGHYDAAGHAVRMEGVALDISKRKASEEALRVMHEQLQASNRELQAFGYSVSHDLRAPLRGIDGWSMALMEDNADQLDERGRGYLGLVRSETQRMGQLIDDLLHLSRVTQSAMHTGPVDLSALAEAIATRLRPPDRPVEICMQPGLEARGDAGLLRVALTNLLENAFKFSGTQPTMRVEFGRIEQKGAPAYFVRDNGVGFDMAFAENLFAPFQRMHRASEFPGSGIGLATVQRVIARHGGRIWAEAQVGHGATFFFTLERTS